MKKALSVILSLLMIISVFAAMPFEALAGMFEFINWGAKKGVADFTKVYKHNDYGMEINENGELYFDNPSGTPYAMYYTEEKEPTQEVDIVMRWRDQYNSQDWFSFTLEGVKTNGKQYGNTVQVKSLMDAQKLPSGIYDVTITDVDSHTYDWEWYSYIEHYTFTRVVYGEVVYHSPHKMLDTPSYLRWEGNVAKWEPVKNVDRYSCTLRDDLGNYVDSKIITKGQLTEVDFSSSHPYEGCVFEVQALADKSDYIRSLTATSPFYHAYQVTYWPNGGTGSQVYTGAAAGNLVLSTDSKGIGAPSSDYVFAGWSTTPDGKNVVDSIYLDKDTDLYATWRKVGGSLTTDDKVRWSLDESTGRLYIIGDGAIPYYDIYHNPSPFGTYADEIKSIEIGPGITRIGDWAFANLTKLETLDLSHANSLYSIGSSAFSGCTSLSDIIYPSDLGVGITGLGSNAFRDCSSLTGFCLSDGEEGQYLSYGVFEGCTSLKSVTLPKTLLTLADTTFKDCENLEMVFYGGTDEDWAELTKYHTDDVLNDARLFTNSSWGVQVGDDAYYVADAFGQTGRIIGTGGTYGFGTSPARVRPVQEVIVEEGITTLGANMFYGCDFITNLTLPSTLVRIEAGSIQQCNGLESLVLPSSMKQIASYVVADNTNLKTVYLSKNLQSVDPAAFTGCTALETVYCDCTKEEFFNSVYVGGNNDPLRNAEFIVTNGKCGDNVNYSYEPTSATLTISGIGAMYEFTSNPEPINEYKARPWYNYRYDIKHVVIEDGVTTVGRFAFSYCQGIETVELGSTVQSIGNYAFDGCMSLAEINMPESITSIGTSAFNECQSIKAVIIPRKVKEIQSSTFSGCIAMESIFIPKAVTKIGTYAFHHCPLLTSVYYGGSENDFLAIDIENGNSQLEHATIYINTGWQTVDGKRYYFVDGEPLKGKHVIEGKTYIFSKTDGEMLTGKVRCDGKWYIMSKSTGEALSGKVRCDGKWYIMSKANYEMLYGKVRCDGKWYIMSKTTGEMCYGKVSCDGKMYIMSKSTGEMLYGKVTCDGKTYICSKSDGHIFTNQYVTCDGVKYYCDKNGVATKV